MLLASGHNCFAQVSRADGCDYIRRGIICEMVREFGIILFDRKYISYLKVCENVET